MTPLGRHAAFYARSLGIVAIGIVAGLCVRDCAAGDRDYVPVARTYAASMLHAPGATVVCVPPGLPFQRRCEIATPTHVVALTCTTEYCHIADDVGTRRDGTFR